MRYVLATTAAVLATLGMGGLEAKAADYGQVNQVQNWYYAYLGRQAEPCGLTTWLEQWRCRGPEAVQAGILASQMVPVAYGNRWTIVVDEDIDPSNLSEVVWAMGTRCDPGH